MAEGSRENKLTQEKKKEAIAWLKSRGISVFVCAVCQKNDSWGIGDYETRLQAADSLLGGTGYPLVVFMCHNCAHTVLFNAIIMGVAESKGKDDGDGLIPCPMALTRALAGRKSIMRVQTEL